MGAWTEEAGTVPLGLSEPPKKAELLCSDYLGSCRRLLFTEDDLGVPNNLEQAFRIEICAVGASIRLLDRSTDL